MQFGDLQRVLMIISSQPRSRPQIGFPPLSLVRIVLSNSDEERYLHLHKMDGMPGFKYQANSFTV